MRINNGAGRVRTSEEPELQAEDGRDHRIKKEAMDTPFRLCRARDRARSDHTSRAAQDAQDILWRRDYILSEGVLPGAAMRPRSVL